MSNKRNIVLIFVDQLRPDFIGPYGADFIKTPCLDELARNGVTYDNAIASSTVCSPSRASVLTGQYVSGHDVWTNLNHDPFKEGTEFIADRLNANGYMTAAVGFSDHVKKETPRGYRYMNMFSSKPDSKYMTMLREKYPDAETYHDDDGTMHFKYPEEYFYDRWCCDAATEFIDSYAKDSSAPDGQKVGDDAPFFLYCGLLSPHTPLTPPYGHEDKIDDSKIPTIFNSHRDDISHVERYRRAFLNSHADLINPEGAVERRMKQRKAYCELICEVDSIVGRIVQSLKDNGLYENTTIMFTSDHGSVDNDYNVVTKGPWPYRNQLFIPLIVSNAPGVEKDTHSDCLCGNIDVGATALALAEDDKRFGVSRSLIGMANGSVPEREVHMSEFCDACKTLVTKQYTFTYYPFTAETCLYDRINDPTEMTNLSGRAEYAYLERRLLMHVIDFMCIAKGVRLEAHDVAPAIRAGIEEKDPKFLDNFDIAFPLVNLAEYTRVKEAGLDPEYNSFCLDREIKAHYGVYFEDEEYIKAKAKEKENK